MSVPNFLSYDATNGRNIEVAPATSGGVGDAEKIPALDLNGKLVQAMMPTGIGSVITVLPASENLVAGDFVNFFDDAGTIKARKADATDSSKPAHGYVDTAVTASNDASVYADGQNAELSALTKGDVYFLSATTAGTATNTPPASSGNLVQKLGVAVAATTVIFKPQEIVIRA